MIYTFDQFSLDTDALKLTNGEGPIALEPQVFDLLAMLVENRDRIISKDEIIDHVWDGRIVSDGTLNTRMNAVRRAVGDTGKAQDIVRTFPRRGFRFMADVDQKADQASFQNGVPLKPPDQPSIVVMPFDNLSEEPDQDYFSDGITEDIITALSHIRQFFVISRASSFYFKGKNVSVRDVAEEFGVRYVLEGSVRKSGGRVRISAQLVDGLSGNTLWAESYDRDLEDMFALQDEITETIVGQLTPAMILADAERAVRMPDGNLAAWDLLQRGNYHFYLRTDEGFIEARKYYELAIDKAPELVFAYSALSELYFFDSIWRFLSTHEIAIDQALLLGRKAVVLDRDGAVGHIALGRALMGEGMATGHFDGAISSLEHALSINANMAQAHYMLGRVSIWSDDIKRGRVHIDAAIRLSPRDPYLGLMNAGLGEAAFLEKDYENCVRWMEKSIRNMPALTWVARCSYIAALAHLDRPEDAKAARDDLLEIVPDFGADLVKHKFKSAFQAEVLSGLAKIGPDQ